jgi:TonB family protein
MSAEASNSMSAAWTNLEGHVLNGVFPLLRYVGSSEQSGVFLTESAKHTQSQVAVKLVPVSAARADAQLSHWQAVVALDHPHLLRMFEAGQCSIGEQRYLYAVIEHADQNLSQLLENRALAEDEAREMLVPTLSALAFLHERELVQGSLKPSNVLVVGEQLKLASDTVRAVVVRTMVEPGGANGAAGSLSGGVDDVNGMSAYDPPEARDGVRSTSGDIWALGVTMCEALTRRRPAGLHAGGGSIVLPPDIPQAFREVVARCLRKPAERPRVTELQAWLRGEGLERAATVASQAAPTAQPVTPPPPRPPLQSAQPEQPVPSSQVAGSSQPSPPPPPPQAARPPRPAPIVMPEGAIPAPPIAPVTPPATEPASKSTTRLVIRAELMPKDDPGTSVSQGPKWRVLPLTVAGIAVLGIIWAGARMFMKDEVDAPPAKEVAQEASSPAPAAVQSPSASGSTSASASTSKSGPTAASAPKPAPAVRAASSSTPTTSTAQANRVESAPGATPQTVNEVLPDVSLRSRQTIRGTVRVSIRLIVDKEGKVFAALTDKPGPSRYFERLALDAAKKWTFTPADAEGQRVVLVRFNFTRSGTTARATPVR